VSNPIYNWIHHGISVPIQGLPDSLLDQIKRDPNAHPTAGMDATFESARTHPTGVRARERSHGRLWALLGSNQ
jgi:hypothetical protein